MAHPEGFPARASTPHEVRELSLDLAQIALDIAGVVDPTPICDGLNALIAVGRGRWQDAALSIVGIVPYVGDLAKAGKFPRYLKTVDRAIALASQSADAAKILRPIVQRIDKALDLLPNDTGVQLAKLRARVKSFLTSSGARPVARYALPDVSRQFRFREFRSGSYTYKEGVGRLGVPGKVKTHRSASSQRSVSQGTGDDAGHLIGNQFGPKGGAENLALQNWRTNRGGTYKTLENDWAAKLQRGVGIEVEVLDVTKVGETRAFMRTVRWNEIDTMGAVTRRELSFVNTHTAQSRAAGSVRPTVSHPQRDNVTFIDFIGRRRM